MQIRTLVKKSTDKGVKKYNIESRYEEMYCYFLRKRILENNY